MSTNNTTTKAFVYGTLRSGHGNNRVMFEKGGDARLIGRATTREKFFLGDGGFPRASEFTHPRAPTAMRGKVVGEVWEVNAEALANMDHLEGHPNFYTRRKVRCTLEDGSTTTAWIYLTMSMAHRPSARSLIKPVNGKVEWLRNPINWGSIYA
jgi:gamma-glutamylaminecyclotransferase